MIKGSVAAIETLGLVDGPGIRTVVFLNGCKLRCKYCHNPEMWHIGCLNYTVNELIKKIITNKPYWRNRGGVTFSGGEPLIQIDFLIEVCKELKKENINIALDTAGIGLGKYELLLPYIDLIIFDVKHTTQEGFTDLTGMNNNELFRFLKIANDLSKRFWVRQVIVPGLMDNKEYLYSLKKFINQYIHNVEKIEFIPFHYLGREKYEKLGIEYPLNNIPEMDKNLCQKLYEEFIEL